MIRETYEKIVQGIDVRQNVSLLRKELKEENARPALAYLLSGDFSVLEKLLTDEDAKTRKNTALLIGDLGDSRLLKALFILPFEFSRFPKEHISFPINIIFA